MTRNIIKIKMYIGSTQCLALNVINGNANTNGCLEKADNPTQHGLSTSQSERMQESINVGIWKSNSVLREVPDTCIRERFKSHLGHVRYHLRFRTSAPFVATRSNLTTRLHFPETRRSNATFSINAFLPYSASNLYGMRGIWAVD